MSDSRGKTWISKWQVAENIPMGADDDSFKGGCFGFTQVWARRIESHPSESPAARRRWMLTQQPAIFQAQKEYERLCDNPSAEQKLKKPREQSLERCKTGMATAKLIVDIDGSSQIHIKTIDDYPLWDEVADEGHINKFWKLKSYVNRVQANTMYFYDVLLANKDEGSGAHACAARHQTSLSSGGSFTFYDANAGEFLVPNDKWDELIKLWALEYANKHGVFVQRLTLVPIRMVLPVPADLIPIIVTEWDAGLLRWRSDESKAATGKLLQLTRVRGQDRLLQEAIRWYAHRITQDPGGALAQRHGTQPAADSTLCKMLYENFSSHPFFNA